MPTASLSSDGLMGPPASSSSIRLAVLGPLRDSRLPRIDVDVRGRPPHRRPLRRVIPLVVPTFEHRPAVLTVYQ